MSYTHPIKHPVLAALADALAEHSECCDIAAMLEEANLTGEEAIEFLSLFARSYPEEFVQECLVRWLDERAGKDTSSHPVMPVVGGWCSYCGAGPEETAGEPGNEFCHKCGQPWVSFILDGTWTPADQDAALKEGWGLFTVPGGPLHVEKSDITRRFQSDEAALKWVRYNAAHYTSPSGMRSKKALMRVEHSEATTLPSKPGSDPRLAAYVAAKGERCPVCGADDTHMTGELPVVGDGEPGVCTQEISCSNCGAAWEDTYTLASTRIIEEDPHFMETELPKAPEPTVLKLSGEMRTVPIERAATISVEGPDDERKLHEAGFTDVRIGDHTVILDTEDLPCAPASPPPAAPPALYMNVIKALMSERFTDDDYRMLTALHRQPAPERALFCMVGDTSNGWFLYMGDEPEENAEMLDMCRRIFSPDFCAEIEMAMKDTDVDWLRVSGTDVDDTPEEAPVKRCKICKRVLDVPGDPTSVDRGGDCTRCMAEAGDPDARIAMHAHTGDPQWQPDPEDYKHTK